jgi:hypothetical protein
MKAEIVTKVNFTVKTELSEGDLMALDALVGYGTDSFLECFYKNLGSSYLKPHEQNLRDLFAKIEHMRPEIDKIKQARKALQPILKF